MLPVSADTIRLFLHVVAATVWVGGQLTLAALVPALRTVSPTAPRTAARRFNLVAWPAYVVLVGTGIWNVIEVQSHVHGSYQTTLTVKVAVVAASGIAAALHTRAKSTAGLAVWGALTGLTALAALFLGVMLAN